MKISTTQNGLVVYTSNFLPKPDISGEEDGNNHKQHAAICLETSQFNDAVNKLNSEIDGWPKE